MCGIAGFIDFKKQLTERDLRAMTDRIAHRGPDASGYWWRELQSAAVGLGHRRLSIIDLSEGGAQPKVRGHLRITFNGEMYNYVEVREELEKHGHSFQSESDTEVILAAFQQWGAACLERFIGMFAFVLVDENIGKAYLVRDRAGVKPLYIYENKGQFLFASELKSFHTLPQFQKEINPDALRYYFQYGYIPTPHTIFKNCKKLEPGSYLEIDLNKQTTRTHTYWNIYEKYEQPLLDLSEKELLDETEKLLTSAFQYRIVADVPVGVFLSGGYDSSVVTAILQANSTQKIKTFTIGFENPKYDESPHARRVAAHLGTDHTEYICTEQEAKNIIPELPEIFDEPFGDISTVPTTLVSRIARKHVTVALSADGGDELFAGYSRYHAVANLHGKTEKIPAFMRQIAAQGTRTAQGFLGKKYNQSRSQRLLKGKAILQDNSPVSILQNQVQRLVDKDLQQLLLKQGKAINQQHFATKNDPMNAVLAWEYRNYMMDDILVKVDRATMSVALEGREPFLDQRIAEWVAQIPFEQKYRDGNLKDILKKITHRHIPREIMERPKMGFSIPVIQWLKTDLRDLTETYLDEQRIREAGIFNPQIVAQQKNAFLTADSTTHFEWLWFLLMFEMWREKWM